MALATQLGYRRSKSLTAIFRILPPKPRTDSMRRCASINLRWGPAGKHITGSALYPTALTYATEPTARSRGRRGRPR